MCKVSICIPCYNQPDSLRRCLNSITIQTFKDYEIVITDDSLDDSIQKIVELNSQSCNIKYYKNNRALGSPANWNEAIGKAAGEYIKILHHDDWFTYEDSLLNFIELVNRNPDADFALSGTVDVSSSKKTFHYLTPDKAKEMAEFPEILFCGNLIGAPSAVIFKNNNLFFDDQLKWLVDIEFYIRLLRGNRKFSYVTKPLVSIGISNDQITNDCEKNKKLNIKEYTYVYEKLNLYSSKRCTQHLLRTLAVFNASYFLFGKYGFDLKDYIRINAIILCHKLEKLLNKLPVVEIKQFVKISGFEILYFLAANLTKMGLYFSSNTNKSLLQSNIPYDILKELKKPTSPTFLIVDKRFALPMPQCRNVYLQLEPELIVCQEAYLLKHWNRFDSIITYNQNVLNQCPNAKLFHLGCSWIKPEEYNAINWSTKKYAISTIIGNKKKGVGHGFRQLVYHRQKEMPLLTCYRSSREGQLDNPYQNKLLSFESKIELFSGYQYSLVIENVRQENYFSEKLIDCLITRTIPIYYGDPAINKIFDTTGWIILEEESVDELVKKMIELNEDHYQNHIKEIEANYQKTLSFVSIPANINRALDCIKDY